MAWRHPFSRAGIEGASVPIRIATVEAGRGLLSRSSRGPERAAALVALTLGSEELRDALLDEVRASLPGPAAQAFFEQDQLRYLDRGQRALARSGASD